MISPEEQSWLLKVYESAVQSGHVWPAMAAAEAALESSWGKSRLAELTSNLFGLKKPSTWRGQTFKMPTQEFIGGKWITVQAVWPCFNSYAQCMTERMNVLKANACYAPALAAQSAEEYIEAVSKHWSTDPARANKVLEIYRAHSASLIPCAS